MKDNIVECQRCGAEFSNKQNLKKHVNKKTICKPLLEDLTREKLIEMNELIKKKVLPICKYCDAEFTNRHNKSRHEKKCFDAFMKDVETKKIFKEQTDMILELREQIKELGKQVIQNAKNNIKGNQNNVANGNNNKIIVVHNYGCENKDYISREKIIKILNGNDPIPKLMKLVHFNSKHPENHNIKLTNINNKYCKVKRNDHWRHLQKKKFIPELMRDNRDFIEEKLKEDEVEDPVLERFDKVDDLVEKESKHMYENVFNEMVIGTKKIMEKD